MFGNMTRQNTENNSPFDFPASMFAERQIRHLRSYKTPNQNGGWLYQFYITNHITSPEIYIDMIQDLRMASPTDSVFIYLNTEGGEVDTGTQIINAMKESNATIHTVLEGRAYSVGGLIFLSGDVKIVQPDGNLMLHNYSAGVGGKGHEILHQINGYNNYIVKLSRSILIPFLSEQEFNLMIDGKDYWFSGDVVAERLAVIEKQQQLTNLEQELIELEEHKEEVQLGIEEILSQINELKQQMKEEDPEQKSKQTVSRSRSKKPPKNDPQLLQESESH